MVSRGTLKATALLLAVFALGVLTGTGATVAYGRREGGFPRDPGAGMDRARLHALSRALDLDSAQRDRIGAILEGHRAARRATWDRVMTECGEPLRKQKAALDAEIRASLTPAQQARFDALSREQDERFFHPRHGPR